ncbi:MAG: hypothetical protein ACPG20_01305, partial [Pontimonas sp.]
TTLENFLPLPFGGIHKRPGTIHLASQADDALLETVRFTDGVSYVLAFSASSLRIYEQDGTLDDTITADFGDPFLLQFAQLNDVLFVVHPDYPPRRLTNLPGTGWRLDEIEFTNPPLIDENTNESLTIETDFDTNTDSTLWADATVYAVGDRVEFNSNYYVCNYAHTSTTSNDPEDGATYVVSNTWVNSGRGGYFVTVTAPIWSRVWTDATALAGSPITLTASDDLFDSDMEGGYIQISKRRDVDDFEVEAAGYNQDTTSDPIRVLGGWEFFTTGTWKGTFYVQRYNDLTATWEDFRAYDGNGDRNVTAEGNEPTSALLRIRFDHLANGVSGARGRLSAVDPYIRGIVKIDSVTSATVATGTVVTPTEKATTSTWALGAFSDYLGHPSAIAIHDRRLIYGGTATFPVSLWISATDDLVNFDVGVDDDDAIFTTLASRTQEPIRWIASQRRLYVGTSVGEWVFGSDSSEQPLTPTNLIARQHTSYGSAAIAPLAQHEGLFFIERQSRRLREFAYLLERESYQAADLTRLAEHITESGITDMDWQSNREPFLWCVREDGVALAFAYHRQERIAAWSRHTTKGGTFRSVAVLRNDTDDDDVYFLVKRGSTYHLECLATGQQATQEAGTVTDAHHVDSAVIGSTSGGTNDLTTPAHLDGETLNVLADGAPTTATAASGSISLDEAATTVHAGLPVTSTFESLPFDLNIEGGVTHSRKKRAHEIALDVFQSYGGAITYDGQSDALRYDIDQTEAPVPLSTAYLTTNVKPAHMDDLTFTVTHSDPTPFTLRAAVLRWQVHEP